MPTLDLTHDPNNIGDLFSSVWVIEQLLQEPLFFSGAEKCWTWAEASQLVLAPVLRCPLRILEDASAADCLPRRERSILCLPRLQVMSSSAGSASTYSKSHQGR